MKAEYNRPREWGNCRTWVNLILFALPVPNAAVAHSPTPSNVRMAASAKGEGKNALAA